MWQRQAGGSNADGGGGQSRRGEQLFPLSLPEADVIYILAVFRLRYPSFFAARVGGSPGNRGKRARVGLRGSRAYVAVSLLSSPLAPRLLSNPRPSGLRRDCCPPLARCLCIHPHPLPEGKDLGCVFLSPLLSTELLYCGLGPTEGLSASLSIAHVGGGRHASALPPFPSRKNRAKGVRGWRWGSAASQQLEGVAGKVAAVLTRWAGCPGTARTATWDTQGVCVRARSAWALLDSFVCCCRCFLPLLSFPSLPDSKRCCRFVDTGPTLTTWLTLCPGSPLGSPPSLSLPLSLSSIEGFVSSPSSAVKKKKKKKKRKNNAPSLLCAWWDFKDKFPRKYHYKRCY
ncbi:uncharacterized protein LOC118155639 [Oxyura jamaicensis]|uniref:uncharacterized protein LOC118155639 n=1 Tax=Oxyura jamaicensis TaxID=8884 RepID=UPI0015A5E75B|nr:uncharacterized protein LOC118155639 [Oxyura jamaicensis]